MADLNMSLPMPPYGLDEEVYPLLMPRWGYAVSAFILFIIGFFGFFLNLMVILLMIRDRQLWTPMNLILFNLVCSDFFVALLGNPLTLFSALLHHWIFGNTMCMLYGFFMALLGISSITTLTVLSFERYMMVTRPLTARHMSSRGAGAIVLFIWLYSLALTTPPLFGWGSYVHEAANISCSVNWHEQTTNSLSYILFLFFMGQVVPMTIISFSYINIIRTISQSTRRMGRVKRAEAKVTGMVFVMIIAFAVAWTPYSVFALIEQFGPAGTITPGVGVIPALVAKSSICYDPIIYIGMNTQFRQAIRRLFGRQPRRGLSHTERGYDNTVMSPAHRCSRATEAVRPEPAPRKLLPADHQSLTVHEYKLDDELALTQRSANEQNTASEMESAGDTVCEEHSSKNSAQADKPASNTDGSLACQRTLLKQVLEDFDNINESVYCRQGFETKPLELTAARTGLFKKKIQHSYSMDMMLASKEVGRRKLSAETELHASFRSRLLEHDDDGACRTFLCHALQGQGLDDDDFVD